MAHKKDSQDICFIPDNDYASFIDEAAPDRVPGPGDFVLSDGTVVGKHEGVTHYTIGQRRGLGISVGKRIFVKEIDAKNNRVVLGDDDDVFTDHLVADQTTAWLCRNSWTDRNSLPKIRYSHKGTKCHVKMLADGQMRLDFEEPVRAVTPGQAVVLYDGHYVAGGGTIVQEMLY